MQELKVGMELKKDYMVTRTETAQAMGSGGLEVLATPILVAWAENAACACPMSRQPLGSTLI